MGPTAIPIPPLDVADFAFPHTDSLLWSSHTVVNSALQFADWALLQPGGRKRVEGVGRLTLRCRGAQVCANSPHARDALAAHPLWNIAIDRDAPPCTSVVPPATADTDPAAAGAAAALRVERRCHLPTCGAPMIHIGCDVVIRVRSILAPTIDGDPHSVVRIVGTCTHPITMRRNGARHASERDIARLRQMVDRMPAGLPTNANRVVGILDVTGQPISDHLQAQQRAIGMIIRGGGGRGDAQPGRSSGAINAATVEELRGAYGDEAHFVYSGGSANSQGAPMQMAWHRLATVQLVNELLDRSATIPQITCDMTFRIVAGTTNVVTILMYDPVTGRTCDLMHVLTECPPRGGSLNAAGWTRCFLAFFRAYPNLIYRDIVRIDKVVMDFETAERYGFLIAVEAIIQTQELNVESPTYNERVQLQQWMMAGTFPTAGDAQHAARCDALLEAARDRCRHMLVGCDYHLMHNFQNLRTSYDDSNRLLYTNLGADIDRLCGRTNDELSYDDTMAIIARVERMANQHPQATREWLAVNFRPEIQNLWIGRLRVQPYANYCQWLRDRVAREPGNALLAQILEQAERAALDCALPSTTSPLESRHAEYQRIASSRSGQSTQHTPRAFVEMMLREGRQSESTRSLVRRGMTTPATRTAARHANAAQADNLSGRQGEPRQNPNQRHGLAPQTPRSTRTSRQRREVGADLEDGASIAAMHAVQGCLEHIAHRNRAHRASTLNLVHLFLEHALSAPATTVYRLAVRGNENASASSRLTEARRAATNAANEHRNMLRRLLAQSSVFEYGPCNDTGVDIAHSYNASDGAADISMTFAVRRNVSEQLLNAAVQLIERSQSEGSTIGALLNNPRNETPPDMRRFACSPWRAQQLRGAPGQLYTASSVAAAPYETTIPHSNALSDGDLALNQHTCVLVRIAPSPIDVIELSNDEDDAVVVDGMDDVVIEAVPAGDVAPPAAGDNWVGPLELNRGYAPSDFAADEELLQIAPSGDSWVGPHHQGFGANDFRGDEPFANVNRVNASELELRLRVEGIYEDRRRENRTYHIAQAIRNTPCWQRAMHALRVLLQDETLFPFQAHNETSNCIFQCEDPQEQEQQEQEPVPLHQYCSCSAGTHSRCRADNVEYTTLAAFSEFIFPVRDDLAAIPQLFVAPYDLLSLHFALFRSRCPQCQQNSNASVAQTLVNRFDDSVLSPYDNSLWRQMLDVHMSYDIRPEQERISLTDFMSALGYPNFTAIAVNATPREQLPTPGCALADGELDREVDRLRLLQEQIVAEREQEQRLRTRERERAQQRAAEQEQERHQQEAVAATSTADHDNNAAQDQHEQQHEQQQHEQHEQHHQHHQHPQLEPFAVATAVAIITSAARAGDNDQQQHEQQHDQEQHQQQQREGERRRRRDLFAQAAMQRSAQACFAQPQPQASASPSARPSARPSASPSASPPASPSATTSAAATTSTATSAATSATTTSTASPSATTSAATSAAPLGSVRPTAPSSSTTAHPPPMRRAAARANAAITGQVADTDVLRWLRRELTLPGLEWSRAYTMSDLLTMLIARALNVRSVARTCNMMGTIIHGFDTAAACVRTALDNNQHLLALVQASIRFYRGLGQYYVDVDLQEEVMAAAYNVPLHAIAVRDFRHRDRNQATILFPDEVTQSDVSLLEIWAMRTWSIYSIQFRNGSDI